MKYTTETEKKKVRNAFKVFLTQNDLNLKKFCDKHLTVSTYNQITTKINRDQIDHNWIESLAKKVNESAKLEKFNELFVFTFKSK